MFDSFLLPSQVPFTIALSILAVTSIIHIASAMIGLGTFDFLDGWLPDLDVDMDLDVGDAVSADHMQAGFFEAILAWLNLGKVPFIITFNLFLFCFAVAGYVIVAIGQNLGVDNMPWMLSVPVAIAATLVPVRWGNALAAKVWPKDETAAVSGDRFIGRVATITIGTATHERPAEAKLTGPKGRVHYIMVVADVAEHSFNQGTQVLLVGRQGSHFTAIPVTNENLTD